MFSEILIEIMHKAIFNNNAFLIISSIQHNLGIGNINLLLPLFRIVKILCDVSKAIQVCSLAITGRLGSFKPKTDLKR